MFKLGPAGTADNVQEIAPSVPPPEYNSLGMREILPTNGTAVGDVSYEILGADMQLLSLSLPPGLTVTNEPGAMMLMDPSIQGKVNCDNCFGRCCAGESCIMSTYTNTGESNAMIGLTPNKPAKVIPLHMHETGGQAYRVKNGSYFASLGETKLGYNFDCNPATCCFSGQGCIHERVEGSGTAYLAAMGTVMTRVLNEGEVIVVDTNSVVAWEDSVQLSIRRTGGLCTCCFGGEGLFNTTLTGPGSVYFQSMSYERFKAALMVQAGATGSAAGAAAGAAADAASG